jgi:hypothetical protein
VAYLLCELVWRLRAVGDSEEDAVRLPMTQTDLADVCDVDDGIPVDCRKSRLPDRRR